MMVEGLDRNWKKKKKQTMDRLGLGDVTHRVSLCVLYIIVIRSISNVRMLSSRNGHVHLRTIIFFLNDSVGQ